MSASEDYPQPPASETPPDRDEAAAGIVNLGVSGAAIEGAFNPAAPSGVGERAEDPSGANPDDLERLDGSYLPDGQTDGRFEPIAVDERRFTCVGMVEDGVYAMTSQGTGGEETPFFIYRSKSQGGWRASQGKIAGPNRGGTWLKGRKTDDRDAQYTQDTRLHPSLEEYIKRIDSRHAEGTVFQSEGSVPVYKPKEADQATKEFKREVSLQPLGPPGLDTLLHLHPVAKLGRFEVAFVAGTDPYEGERAVSAVLMETVEKINKELIASGAIPDFSSEPAARDTSYHDELGTDVIYETYIKNGKQWVMAQSADGQDVWIDRIRDVLSPVSAYGTDQRMVYSGLLTSKPLEYLKQCDAIPPELRSPVSRGQKYSKITPFLRRLAPVDAYVKVRGQFWSGGEA